ncbi:helix-turn-helix transcriptional regulator [Ruminococcus sp.]|uniref:helix-turn-helix domain-containing protein n=1 Tax=Ruminococcus sp. TaxID=41978 RepID=UPI0025CE7174|nr:helix-turn-helix transcriptional regulator [Ruminococcus sp.]
MTIGERIKARREELGLSVDEVAEVLNKSRATVYRYESNEIEKLPTTVLEPLSKILRTTPAYLIGWEDDPIDYDDPDIVSELRTDILDRFNGDAKAAYKAQQAIYDDAAKVQAEEQDENLVILNRNAKKLTPEKRKQLLDMARLMFKEEFDD